MADISDDAVTGKEPEGPREGDVRDDGDATAWSPTVAMLRLAMMHGANCATAAHEPVLATVCAWAAWLRAAQPDPVLDPPLLPEQRDDIDEELHALYRACRDEATAGGAAVQVLFALVVALGDPPVWGADEQPAGTATPVGALAPPWSPVARTLGDRASAAGVAAAFLADAGALAQQFLGEVEALGRHAGRPLDPATARLRHRAKALAAELRVDAHLLGVMDLEPDRRKAIEAAVDAQWTARATPTAVRASRERAWAELLDVVDTAATAPDDATSHLREVLEDHPEWVGTLTLARLAPVADAWRRIDGGGTARPSKWALALDVLRELGLADATDGADDVRRAARRGRSRTP